MFGSLGVAMTPARFAFRFAASRALSLQSLHTIHARAELEGVGQVSTLECVREFGRCDGSLTLSWCDTPPGLDAWLVGSVSAQKVVEVRLCFAKESC